MSVHVESWAWKQEAGGSLAKLILVKLAQNADDDGWSWWKQSNIAKECETSRSTVNKHIAALRGRGVIQIHETRKGDGSRGPNYYRVMVPWADPAEAPPLERRPLSRSATAGDGALSGSDTGGAREDDRGSVGARQQGEPSFEPSSEEPRVVARAREARPLGDGRWKVGSSTTEGREYVADLRRNRCSCQARTGCHHLEAAQLAEQALDGRRRDDLRAAVWDELAEQFGPPTQRQSADRGQLVVEVGEMLALAKVPQQPEAWRGEIGRRVAALRRGWGRERTTLRAFVREWQLAGDLADGKGEAPNGNGKSKGLSAGDMHQVALRLEEEGR